MYKGRVLKALYFGSMTFCVKTLVSHFWIIIICNERKEANNELINTQSKKKKLKIHFLYILKGNIGLFRHLSSILQIATNYNCVDKKVPWTPKANKKMFGLIETKEKPKFAFLFHIATWKWQKPKNAKPQKIVLFDWQRSNFICCQTNTVHPQ